MSDTTDMNASQRAESDNGHTANPSQTPSTSTGPGSSLPARPPPADFAHQAFGFAQQPYASLPYGLYPQDWSVYYNQWYQYQASAQYWHHTAQAHGLQLPLYAPGQLTAGIPDFAMDAAVQNVPSPNMSAPQEKDGASITTELGGRNKKHKDPKIMLPAPPPSDAYLDQAKRSPEVVDPPDMKLVILDLNGTLLYRPDPRRQPKLMVGRPYLPQFLQYLFDNFAVMIWSSARPPNVRSLVENGLKEYQSQLIAEWARDTLGLAPHHYSKNVQCYKNLNRVWASDEVQCNMLGYEDGKRFDQRNTILIDDSALKASAQPHNLVEIPEFTGAIDMKQDILGEVAGFLELLKMQEDVSKFIHKTPFRADATWSFDWEYLTPNVKEGKSKDENLKPVILGSDTKG